MQDNKLDEGELLMRLRFEGEGRWSGADCAEAPRTRSYPRNRQLPVASPICDDDAFGFHDLHGTHHLRHIL